MRTILVCLQDPIIRDQIRTALKLFDKVRAVEIPRARLLEVFHDPQATPHALIVDHDPMLGGDDPFIAEIRAQNRDVRIIAVADRPERARFNKAKMEMDVCSFIALPLDPIDVLRRIHRVLSIQSALA